LNTNCKDITTAGQQREDEKIMIRSKVCSEFTNSNELKEYMPNLQLELLPDSIWLKIITA
jgi:hypothetical protein